jgi:ketosteroid isomerase-like protein
MEVQTAAAPDFVWQLLDWTARGDVIMIEWQTTRIVNGARFDWRGVDKFRIKAGKIIEERVYCDTAPLRALRTGEVLEPITRF